MLARQQAGSISVGSPGQTAVARIIRHWLPTAQLPVRRHGSVLRPWAVEPAMCYDAGIVKGVSWRDPEYAAAWSPRYLRVLRVGFHRADALAARFYCHVVVTEATQLEGRMTRGEEITAADLEAFIRLHDLVPVPPDLMPRVLQIVRDHRESMRRFAEAGIDVRDVFPAHLYRP